MAYSEMTRVELLDLLETFRVIMEDGEIPLRDYIGTRRKVITTIENLHALDHGEVSPMFEPAKKKHWFEMPYRIARLREKAVRHFAALRMHGFSASEAYLIIAKAYGYGAQESYDTVKKWRMEHRKIHMEHGKVHKDDPSKPEREFSPEREEIALYRTSVKRGRPPKLELRLKRIEADGKAYLEAKAAKKAEKAPATGPVSAVSAHETDWVD
jgi:hypothetical protein